MKWLFYPIAFFLGIVFVGAGLAGFARVHPCASIFAAAALIPLTLFIPKNLPVLGAIAVVIVSASLFLGPHFIQDVGAACFTQTKARWDASIHELACKLPWVRSACNAAQVIAQSAREDNRILAECLLDAAKNVDTKVCDTLLQGCGVADFNGGSAWMTCSTTLASGKLDPDVTRKCTNPNMLEPIVRLGKGVWSASGRLACGSVYGLLTWLPLKWQPTQFVERVRLCSIEPVLSSCPAL